MKKKIVIALGGNAIKQPEQIGTAEEQFINVYITSEHIIEIIKRGYNVAITHGNGPQVGNLLIQQEEAVKYVPAQPLSICGAMTQGQIGYMLQQALYNKLKDDKLDMDVMTVVTQVLLDGEDPDFLNPSKPVGPFYSEEIAEKLHKSKGYNVKKVKPNSETPFRRVVPSPDPLRIIEGRAIRKMIESGVIVIASGGGGIPTIIDDDRHLCGVEAVIDKDLAGEKLAEMVGADIFMILTDIEKVALFYGSEKQKNLDIIKLEEAKKYFDEGHFLSGSMGPKVKACIRFLEFGGERAIVTSLDKAIHALEGNAGTQIIS